MNCTIPCLAASAVAVAILAETTQAQRGDETNFAAPNQQINIPADVPTTSSTVTVRDRRAMNTRPTTGRGGITQTDHPNAARGRGPHKQIQRRDAQPISVPANAIYSNISFAGCDDDPPNCVSFESGEFPHGSYGLVADDIEPDGSGWLEELSFSLANFSGDEKNPGGTLVGGSLAIVLFDDWPGDIDGVIDEEAIWRVIMVDLENVQVESGEVAIVSLDQVAGIEVTQLEIWAGVQLLDVEFADGPGTIDDIGQGVFEVPDVGSSDDGFFIETFGYAEFTDDELIGSFGWEMLVGDGPQVGECPADLNGDESVNVSDMLALLGEWGACGKGECAADLNDDAAVNVSDLLLLLGAWGQCEPSEPTGACCFRLDGTCENLTADDCLAGNGEYKGDFTSCDSYPCPPPADGQSCEDAFPLLIGDSTSIDTTGFPDGGFSSCGSAPDPNAPTAWYRVVGNGTQLTARTCGSDVASGANVAVLCNDCDGPTCVDAGSLDASCSGNSLNGAVSWCADAGAAYYIAVWGDGGASGEIQLQVTSNETPCTSTIDCGALEQPVCTEPESQCQALSTGVYATTDTGNDLQVADDFHAAQSGDITSLCWKGVDLGASGGFGQCADNAGQGNEFRVTYMEDDEGKPGAQIAQFIDTPEYARIDFVSFPDFDAGLIDYTMTHNPVAVTAGTCYWVEIVHLGTGECLFLWSPSQEGNGLMYQTDLDTSYAYEDALDGDEYYSDRAFCVSIETGSGEECNAAPPLLGVCCYGEWGGCAELTQAECRASFGHFAQGLTCSQVTCPNCGGEYTQDWGTFQAAYISDVDAGLLRYEKVPGSSLNILSTLHVWGINASNDGSGFEPCSPSSQTFNVRVYKDQGGVPGTLLTEHLGVTATAVDTDVYFDPIGNIHRFELDMEMEIVGDAKWISVERDSSVDGCWFLWTDSVGGDGISVVESGGNTEIEEFDLSICINP